MRQIMRLASDEKSFSEVEIMRALQEKVREVRHQRFLVPVHVDGDELSLSSVTIRC